MNVLKWYHVTRVACWIFLLEIYIIIIWNTAWGLTPKKCLFTYSEKDLSSTQRFLEKYCETSQMRPLKVHEKLAAIGSLQLVSHVVHKRHAGTRQTNKQLTSFSLFSSQWVFLVSAFRFFNHVTDQRQRTKKEVALLTWSSHKKLTEWFCDWSKEFSYNKKKVVWTGWSKTGFHFTVQVLVLATTDEAALPNNWMFSWGRNRGRFFSCWDA